MGDALDDFYRRIASRKNSASNNQKEVNQNEDEINRKPQGGQDRPAQRLSQEQVDSSDSQGSQSREAEAPRNQQVVGRGDNSGVDEVQSPEGEVIRSGKKGGELDGEDEGKNAKDGENLQKDGQGLRSEEDARNQAQVTDGSGKVQSQPQDGLDAFYAKYKPKSFGQQLFSKEGVIAGSAALAENLLELGGGSVAAGLAMPEAIAATPVAPVVEGLAFSAGSELTKDIVINPLEKALGISESIEKAKQEAPDVATAGGILGAVPLGIKSVGEYIKVGKEFGEGEVLKRAGRAALGGAIFEPARYVAESGLKAAGIKQDEVEPVTAGSVGMSAAQMAVLGGLGAHEQILREKGAKILEDAGLTETAKAAKVLLTDDAIKQKRNVETDKRVAKLFDMADGLVEANDTKRAEKVLSQIEAESKAFPAKDALQSLRQDRINEIKSKIEEAKTKATEAGEEPIKQKPAIEKDPAVKRRIDLAQRHITFGNVDRATAAVDRLEADVAQYPASEEVQNQRIQKIQELRQRIQSIGEKGEKEKFEKDKEQRLAESWKKVEAAPKNSQEHIDAFNEYIKIQAEEFSPSKVSPKQGEPSVGEAKGKTEEGTAQGEGEDQERLVSATFKDKDGQFLPWASGSHPDALGKLVDANAIDFEDYSNYVRGDNAAARRNTEDFGFVTNKGRFVGREEAYKIAKEAGQLATRKFDFKNKEGNVLLHSHEVHLDNHPLAWKEISTKSLHGLTARDALKKLSSSKEVHPKLRELAKTLSQIKFKGLDHDIVTPFTKEEAEQALREEKYAARIPGAVWLRDKSSATAIIHEFIHSTAVDEVNARIRADSTGAEYKKELLDSLKYAKGPVGDLVKLYLHAVKERGFEDALFGENGQANKKSHVTSGINYGFRNIHEFITESFTNSNFQDYLKTIKSPLKKESVWDWFSTIIRNLLNIKKGSVLADVVKKTIEISEENTPNSLLNSVRFGLKRGMTYSEFKALFENPHEGFENQVMPQINALENPEVKDAMGENAKDPETPKAREGFYKFLRKTGLFQEDINAAGIKTFSLEKNPFIDGFKSAINTIADALDGTTIPELTRAGVKASATQFAYAKHSTSHIINGLIAKAFPESFADVGKIKRVTEILAKDNILGVLDVTVDEYNKVKKERDELFETYDSGNAPSGTLGKIKDLEDRMEALSESANRIRDNHDIKSYEKDIRGVKGTEIERMIESYKKNIQPALDQLYKDHTLSENTTQEVAGRVFGGRMNLISSKQEGRIRDFFDPDKTTPRIQVVNYRNPDVKMFEGNQREGIYDPNFSTDLNLILTSSYASRINEVKKMKFYQDLVDKGVAKIVDRHVDVSEINGKPVTRLEAVIPVRDSEGNVTTKNRDLYVQENLADEITQLLDVDAKPKKKGGILNSLTKLQVFGIADAVSHMKGLHGIVIQAVGRDTKMQDWLAKVPVFSSVNAVREIRRYVKMIDNPDAQTVQKLAFLAENVGLRPKYEQENGSPLLPTHEILHKWDTAVRLMMHDYFDNLVKRGDVEDTMDNRINWINKIGEYNNRLQPRWIASLRSTGLSPFLIGGTTMQRSAVSAALARKGFRPTSNKAALEYQAMQLSGLVMAGTLPAIINMATTGSPFGRPGTPIGVIDFGQSFDTDDGKRRAFDLFQLLSYRRGFRTLGINASVQGLIDGLSPDMIWKNVGNDLFTTNMHPFIGPGIGFGYEVAKGERIDLRAGWAESFDARKVGGPMQYVENFRVAIKQQNPLIYGAVGTTVIEPLMAAAGVPAPVEEGSSTVRQGFHKEGWKVDTIWGKAAEALYDSTVSPVMGAAGGKMTTTPALKLSAQIGQKEQYSPEQDKRYSLRQQIFDAYKSGNKTEAMKMYRQGINDGILTAADKKILAGRFKEPDVLIQRTRRTKTAQDAMEIFRAATPEEQDSIYQIVQKKIRGSSSLTPNERKEMLSKLKKVVKKGSKFYTGA